MKYFSFCLFTTLLFTVGAPAHSQMINFKRQKMKSNYAIAIHGGAGNLVKLNLSPDQQKEFKDKMQEALQLGYDKLKAGDSAINVAEMVIKVLEDSPLFNAGKGAVFTHDGTNEMDAAIMDGSNLKAGAVADVRTIKNPVSAAKAVMQNSQFVLLSGTGAEQFAKEQDIEIVDTSYFYTPQRWNQLLKVRDSVESPLDHDSTGMIINNLPDKFGTVGCVVLDRFGNLAAATSTGGTVNKRYKRIGDSPLIGCGTYANNKTCAVSCTGHGEDFIRLVAAYDVSALMEYKGMTLSEATYEVIFTKLKAIDGRGGLIAIDNKGNISFRFNTKGMYRGYVNRHGKIVTHIFKEEEE